MIFSCIGVFGLLVASFGFGAAVACYLCNAPNSSLYDWLGHWPIIIGCIIYLFGFSMLESEFFDVVPAMVDWCPLAFLIGGFAVWGCVRAKL